MAGPFIMRLMIVFIKKIREGIKNDLVKLKKK